jgi:hypothetical protein
MNTLGYISTGLSLLLSIVSIVVVITNLRANVDALNKQEERMTEKLEESTKDITNLLVEVKSFISEQTTINRFVSKTLEGVVDRCVDCRDQSVHQDGVAALLAEMLRHKKIVDIG